MGSAFATGMLRRPVRAAALAALGLFLFVIHLKQPRHDCIWQADLAPTPGVSETAAGWAIAPYRDWTYTDEAPRTRGWTVFGPFDPAAAKRAWLVVEPHPGLALMAHTLVIFEFEDGRMAGVSVEARKEAHETYSPLFGAFNRFELLYQWASPKDLLTRRAVMMDRALYMYPLALSDGETEALLRALMKKTMSIAARPRFYNTLTSNCTNELAKAAGLGWDPAFVFTGYAANALYADGRLAGEGNFEVIRQAARLDDWVRAKAGLDGPAFEAALAAR